mmetsp:Transcript_38599/g.110950  ORF Transcript_38599/g.110950 Transcript_38599/m.110950 type:complete len:249 (+) Transcript_38599:94-840(+)
MHGGKPARDRRARPERQATLTYRPPHARTQLQRTGMLVAHDQLRTHMVLLEHHEFPEGAARLFPVIQHGVAAALALIRLGVVHVADVATEHSAEDDHALAAGLHGRRVLVRLGRTLGHVDRLATHRVRRRALQVEAMASDRFGGLLRRAMKQEPLVDTLVKLLRPILRQHGVLSAPYANALSPSKRAVVALPEPCVAGAGDNGDARHLEARRCELPLRRPQRAETPVMRPSPEVCAGQHFLRHAHQLV